MMKTDRMKTKRKRTSTRTQSKGIVGKALGPAADRFGEVAEPLGQEVGEVSVELVRRLLRTVRGLLWAWDRTEDWVVNVLAPKLQRVPRANLVPPDLRIVGPAIEAMRFASDAPEIREMFARLIVNDMNTETKRNVHPSFVESIKQMDRVDALLLAEIHKNGPQVLLQIRAYTTDDPSKPRTAKDMIIGNRFKTREIMVTCDVEGADFGQVRRAINNLERLGLLQLATDRRPVNAKLDGALAEYRASDEYKQLEAQFPGRLHDNPVGLYPTPMGTDFAVICLEEEGESQGEPTRKAGGAQ